MNKNNNNESEEPMCGHWSLTGFVEGMLDDAGYIPDKEDSTKDKIKMLTSIRNENLLGLLSEVMRVVNDPEYFRGEEASELMLLLQMDLKEWEPDLGDKEQEGFEQNLWDKIENLLHAWVYIYHEEWNATGTIYNSLWDRSQKEDLVPGEQMPLTMRKALWDRAYICRDEIGVLINRMEGGAGHPLTDEDRVARPDGFIVKGGKLEAGVICCVPNWKEMSDKMNRKGVVKEACLPEGRPIRIANNSGRWTMAGSEPE